MFNCFVTFVSKYFATKHLLIPCMHRRLWMYRPTAEGPPGYAHLNFFKRPSKSVLRPPKSVQSSTYTFQRLLHLFPSYWEVQILADWLLFVARQKKGNTLDNISSMST